MHDADAHEEPRPEGYRGAAILYLRGLSTEDFATALEGFFGSDTVLPPSTLQRLTQRRRWPRSTRPKPAPAAVDTAAAFAERFSTYPKATAKITDDLTVLLAFYDFPPRQTPVHDQHDRAASSRTCGCGSC